MTVDEGSHSKTELRRGRRLSFRRLSRREAPSLGAPSPLPERDASSRTQRGARAIPASYRVGYVNPSVMLLGRIR
jgi:hypothetical protein